MNSYQIIDAFKAGMQDAGIEPPAHIEADGELHRFHIDGHKSGTQNGAYKLHLDGARPAGYFEDFKTGIKATWKADGPTKPLTKADRQQLQVAKQQRQQKQQHRYEQAAKAAERLLKNANPMIGNNHPYLQRKRVDANGLHRLKLWPKRVKNAQGEWTNIAVQDVLLVPLIDLYGKVWNVQAIFPEPTPQLGRDKDFLSGGRLGGLFHAIGEPTEEIIICEGYATGASLNTATGLLVLCAMSAGNLEAVAKAVRAAYPGKKIFIAADNDVKTPGNPGLTAAKKAAQAVGGFLAVPPIAGDFNDLANMDDTQ